MAKIYPDSHKAKLANMLTNVIQEQKLNAENKSNARQQKIEELKTTLPYLCFKGFEQDAYKQSCTLKGFHDLRNYYKSLNMYPEEITKEQIIARYPDMKNYDFEKIDLALVGLVAHDGLPYDIFYDKITGPTKSKSANTNVLELSTAKADGYFNIRIYGGTWGKIKINNGQTFFNYDPIEFSSITEIPMEQVNDGYLTFPDLTQWNPLIPAHGTGKYITIETDGTTYSYNRLIIDNEPRRVFYTIGNYYSLTWFNSLGLVLCEGYYRTSMIIKTEDIVSS